jgi:N-acetylneuraminic acid mutarotase
MYRLDRLTRGAPEKIAAGLLALGLVLSGCDEQQESPTSPMGREATAGAPISALERSAGCTYSDDQSTKTRTATAQCGNAGAAVPEGWHLRVQPSEAAPPQAESGKALSTTSAALVPIVAPDAGYLGSTLKIDLTSLPEFSTHTSVSTGVQTISFSSTLERLQVPDSWGSWSSPPESESATPAVLWSQFANSLVLTLARPASVVGFELEPNIFDVFTFTASFYSAGQFVGSMTRSVSGSFGASLFAFRSDGPQLDQVSITTDDQPEGFSIAQLRYSVGLWSARAPLPGARRGLAVWTANGVLYAMGGANSAGTALRTVQAYNAATNSWTTKAALPAARQTGNGAASINNIIYLAGGHDAAGATTKTLYAYNTTTNTWSTRAAMPLFSSCGGSAVIAGKVYVFSGCTRNSAGAQIASGRLHRYDPATNAWTTLRAAPVAHFHPVVGAISGKLYVIGGSNGTGTAIGRVDMYDPATNTWTLRAPMPTPRVVAAGVAIGGKFHVFGGRNGTTYLSNVEAYDPVTNSWANRLSMPAPRAALGVAGVSGSLYVVGGRNTSTALTTNERFTP